MGLITYGAILQNEVKGWPALVQIGSGFDLVTQNQWWDDELTPTTKATAVPSSGEAGLDVKFTEVIKCVTDAVNEGFNQRYTYADEPRVKSGVHLSALVWVATTSGGSGITAKLRNSGGTSTSGTSVATDGDWTLLAIEDHTCSGTYVELVVTKDASGTFYAGGPITVMVGADAVGLTARHLVFRHKDGGANVKTLTGIGNEATWTDIDVTSNTSNLTAMALINTYIADDNDNFSLFLRRNGDTTATGLTNFIIFERGATEGVGDIFNALPFILDDGQIFEYYLERGAGSGTVLEGQISLLGYWEWE